MRETNKDHGHLVFGGSLRDPDVGARMTALRSRLDAAQVDALVVTNLANVRYLCGFSGSAGVLIVSGKDALLTTDGRYRTQSGEQIEAAGACVSIEIGGAEEQRDAAKSFLFGVLQVGFEADEVTWNGHGRWASLLEDLTLVPTSGVVEGLREIKDTGEIDRMARAAAIADEALGQVVALLDDGELLTRPICEADFALALDSAMRRLGAEGCAFETIVAAGPNSAKPHHRPGEREMQKGDTVVVDFGAIYEGYRSDMTRTFVLGGAFTGQMERVFDVVRDSQAQGVLAVGPGVEAKAVDTICRDVIKEAGWADRFEHGTGHGVGLDIHEAPTVSQLGTAILAPGFVVTVEPGVYLPGIGGVRIEDTLVVTEDGSRPLTAYTKDPKP